MRKVFVPVEQISEDTIIISGEDVAHIRDVLRMKPDDEIVVSAGKGINYNCRIDLIEKDEIRLDIVSQEPDIAELPIRISLYQSLPKSDKLELVIQKAVELGACEVIPVRSSRCVVKLDDSKAEKKRQRWQKIAEEASKQAGRGAVPEVLPVMSFDEAVKRASSSEGIFIPYELSEEYGSLSNLEKEIRSGIKSISVFIGPEGGFDEKEAEAASESGIRLFSLGRRILRTETAALVFLSWIVLKSEGGSLSP